MQHISEILKEIPVVAQMGQNCKVKQTTVNPAKCEAKTKACHPMDVFAGIEKCRRCGKGF